MSRKRGPERRRKVNVPSIVESISTETTKRGPESPRKKNDGLFSQKRVPRSPQRIVEFSPPRTPPRERGRNQNTVIIN